ncbi:MAG TPA: CoA transferase, partial [Alphaproteobacteria bacterium]|nr:CoA transferase [Alphaproteobacteria bacterium]
NDFVAVRLHPKVGQIKTAWNYIQFSNTASSAGRPTPLLGEHTAEALAEAGFSATEIAELFESGAALAESA